MENVLAAHQEIRFDIPTRLNFRYSFSLDELSEMRELISAEHSRNVAEELSSQP